MGRISGTHLTITPKHYNNNRCECERVQDEVNGLKADDPHFRNGCAAMRHRFRRLSSVAKVNLCCFEFECRSSGLRTRWAPQHSSHLVHAFPVRLFGANISSLGAKYSAICSLPHRQGCGHSTATMKCSECLCVRAFIK